MLSQQQAPEQLCPPPVQGPLLEDGGQEPLDVAQWSFRRKEVHHLGVEEKWVKGIRCVRELF